RAWAGTKRGLTQRIGRRRSPAETAAWPPVVVDGSPVNDDRSRLEHGVECIDREHLVADAGAEDSTNGFCHGEPGSMKLRPAALRTGRTRRRDASNGAGSPWLVLVREPDQLGVERTHPQLAFGVRLVELAEPDRHVAADDDRTPASLDDDHLRAARVARRRDEPDPGKQFELAIDRHVLHAGCIDPLVNCVVVLAARVVELPTLDVDRLAGEEVVAAAVV